MIIAQYICKISRGHNATTEIRQFYNNMKLKTYRNNEQFHCGTYTYVQVTSKNIGMHVLCVYCLFIYL